MALVKQDLIDKLKEIKPEEMTLAEIKSGKIIEEMVDVIYEWVTKAVVTVTIPDDIQVQVDLKTGNGRTIESVEAEGTIS